MLNPIPTHPGLFDEINGFTILKTALSTDGSAGPAGAAPFRKHHLTYEKPWWVQPDEFVHPTLILIH